MLTYWVINVISCYVTMLILNLGSEQKMHPGVLAFLSVCGGSCSFSLCTILGLYA